MRRLVYYVSVTQDGFIAGPGGEFDFFIQNEGFMRTIKASYPETIPTHLREVVGISGENRVFDTVLMGRATYEVGLPYGVVSPYRHLEQYVFSRTLGEVPGVGVELVGGDPVSMVRELKAGDGMDIWLCGGGTLAGVLYDEIDALVLKRHPVLIGAGIPLVAGEFAPRVFRRTQQVDVDGGVIVATYDAVGGNGRGADDP